jgi:uncharacterized protein (TIGR00369 family)
MPHVPRHATGLDSAQVTALIDEHFPLVHEGGGRLTIERISPDASVVRMAGDDRAMRPGGTVAGPAMFKLADFAVYVAILGKFGEAALQAVTTSMTINFLSRPGPGDIVATVRLLKTGRRLAVAQVEIHSLGVPEMVAHATATYAIPSPR